MPLNEQPNNEPIAVITAKFDQLISVILDTKIAPKIHLDVTLWSTKDVADYLGMSYRYTSEYIVTHHTFPNALRLPTKKQTKGHPRWYAGQVIKWAADYQE